MRFKRLIFSGVLAASCWNAVTSAYAWPPKSAFELMFDNNAIDQAWRRQPDLGDTHNPVSEAMRDRFRDEVLTTCRECLITPMTDRYGVKKYRVKYPSGWWFEITLDPATIEITSNEFDRATFERVRPLIDRDIWNVAARLGLRPNGSGHINFEITSTFGDDTLHFRNFIVDYMNHTELGAFMLGTNDTFNAPHIEHLSRAQIRAFREVVDSFDPSRGIKKFATDFQTKVLYKATWDAVADGDPPEKYQGLNVTSIVRDGDPWPRLEIRDVRMQKNSEEFALMMELFEARIKYLKSVRSKIAYTGSKPPAVAGFEEVYRFYQYVTEAGLDWERFKRLVPREHSHLVVHLDRVLAGNAPMPKGGSCQTIFRILPKL